MNIQDLTTRLEINFWDLAIWLLSRSSLAQGLVRSSYDLYDAHLKALTRRMLLFWSVSGFSIGLLIGVIGSLILE